MKLLKTKGWEDYELLDSGDGEKLERFGKVTVIRPDPQIIWQKSLPRSNWDKADAFYKRTSGDKGEWKRKTNFANKWEVKYKDITFYCKLSPFKHTGVFPEQILQWEWIEEKITQAKKEVNVLNLFGYTGIASLVAAKAGAKVTHVDASYSTIGWARENQAASQLDDKPIRWILDDALKFVEREARRGTKYDAIIMDPPPYGHGPNGEKWEFNQSFPKLMSEVQKILSDNPLFVIVNGYAITPSPQTLENVLHDYLKNYQGEYESGELVIEGQDNRLFSVGIFARWSSL